MVLEQPKRSLRQSALAPCLRYRSLAGQAHTATRKRLRRFVRLVAALMCVTLSAHLAAAGDAQYFYDDLGRLSTVVTETGDMAVYRYDAVGNVSSIDRLTPAPTGIGIFALLPGAGAAASQVRIQGYGFLTTPAQNTVTFNGTAATVVSATATALTVTVLAGATSGSVVVTNSNGSATSPQPFTLYVPSVTAISPTVLPQGVTWPVTITGADLVQATAVTFSNSGIVGRIQAGATPTTLPVAVTVGAAVPTGTYTFSVTTAAGTAAGGSITVTTPLPTMSAGAPSLSVSIPNMAVPATGAPTGTVMSVGAPTSVRKP